MQVQYYVNFDVGTYEFIVYIEDIPPNLFDRQKRPFEIRLDELSEAATGLQLKGAYPIRVGGQLVNSFFSLQGDKLMNYFSTMTAWRRTMESSKGR